MQVVFVGALHGHARKGAGLEVVVHVLQSLPSQSRTYPEASAERFCTLRLRARTAIKEKPGCVTGYSFQIDTQRVRFTRSPTLARSIGIELVAPAR